MEKQSFNDYLLTILKKDSRFIDKDGDIIRNAVIDKALKYDESLLSRLIADKKLKEVFFKEINKSLVFIQTIFIDYIQDKNFLIDSYTKYKNKIGLTIDNKYLGERDEVALVWPFKDTVLEGGQTKEEQKRKEIFFNEVLAKDEIDRLFEPKVLTNFKRYTKDGESKIAEINRNSDGVIKENLVIKGNNLLALHTLKKEFAGKVKLIYIDPPYNTGSDSFGYNDSFNHSTWLTFMKNRLEAARTLLRADGSIWINIDDTEVHYLKVICDQIFGYENFVANIVWHKKYTTANDAKGISASHDHILVFQQSESFTRNLLPRGEKQNNLYKYDDKDGKGLWRSDNLLVKTFSKEYVFPIINPNTGKEYWPRKGSCWRASRDTIEKWLKEGRIYFGRGGIGAPQLKRYLNEVQQGIVPNTWWEFDDVGHNDESKKELQKLQFTEKGFSTPKPERLIQRVLQIGSHDNDIVLDFFAGSGTSGAAAHKTGRQYILIEQMDYIHDLPEARLKKVIAGEQGGISKTVNWKGGGSFIYGELKQWNEEFIIRIQDAKSTKELLAIWKDMKEKSFLNYQLDIKKQDEAIEEFKAMTLEKQKHALVELLDKNALYVPLADIDDADFKVSKEDKALNKQFYG